MIRKPCCSRFQYINSFISNIFGPNSKTCTCEVRAAWGLTVDDLGYSHHVSIVGDQTNESIWSPSLPTMVYWGSSWKPNNQTDITRQKLRTVRQSRKSYMLVYLEQQRFKACLRRCQVVQNRVLFENVLGMRMLLLSGSEASNTCSNMHTIPFSPDMAGPQGKFCPFSSVFTPNLLCPFFPL